MNTWDKRYSTDKYVFGQEPSIALTERHSMFLPNQTALAIADGEGRNSVYLSSLGLQVHAVDGSSVALEKAARLAQSRQVQIEFEHADVFHWQWPKDTYDHVVGIFIQFAMPGLRERLFRNMVEAIKPGGHLLLHGYRPEQVALGTGGPPTPEPMYTSELLRDAFSGLEILELTEENRTIEEGKGHRGESALITLVAKKPIS